MSEPASNIFITRIKYNDSLLDNVYIRLYIYIFKIIGI